MILITDNYNSSNSHKVRRHPLLFSVSGQRQLRPAYQKTAPTGCRRGNGMVVNTVKEKCNLPRVTVLPRSGNGVTSVV